MYQESNMDKKPSSIRLNQAQSKGFGSEGKKGQDVANKPWPRGGGRRRESSGGASNKNESSRKPNPQRSKVALDKRPKPRGGNHSGSIFCGKEDAGLTPDSAEIGSVFVQGSKKQSLNHLLNFHYTPRQAANEGTPITYRNSNFNRMQYGLKHKYNKEEFLQATCQFVVNSNGNYEVYMKDPDALVHWELIEQINVQGSEFPRCPICLDSPVAAKMTRCGHIYCWSCILHYLALSDKSWRKCPICFEAIHNQDLKSVVAKPYNNVVVIGNKIEMTLMKRERGSLIATPVEEINYRIDDILNVSEHNLTTAFSKLLIAEDKDIQSIIERERVELEIQLSLDENCPEKCFIEQALSLLLNREKNIPKQCAAKVSKKSLSKNYYSENEDTKQTEVNFKSEENKENGTPTQAPKNFYFYQASDGQHIYLHPLNIRMLEHLYGPLENCPSKIKGTIVEKENGSITEDLRKRMRYLQHLPVTCQFEIAELELESPFLTPEVLDHFKDQIDNRRKRRQKRARDERRHEKRIIEKENRLMGKYPTPHIQIESYRQFPNFVGSLETAEGGSPPLSSASMTTDSFTSLNDYLAESPSLSEGGLCENVTNLHLSDNTTNVSGPSFANMLSKTKVENACWPTLRSNNVQRQAVTNAPNPKLISVTGRTRVGFDIKHQHQQCGNDSDSTEQNDDYVPAPQYNKSFSEALELAVKQVCNDEKPIAREDCGGKKKKKKQGRKILFATGMACTGK